ncbi:hypothetical protein AB4148_15420 [Vibrio sp. 10N.286.51.F4]|uniref:hypothetical protein n=1 Tax=Vibrio sp. 10N.286.51.F4 TaxID=3229710 RepID=UPI003550080E
MVILKKISSIELSLILTSLIFSISVENGTLRIIFSAINLVLSMYLFVQCKFKFNKRVIPTLIILITIALYYISEKGFRGYSYSFHFYISILSLLSAIFYINYIYIFDKYKQISVIFNKILYAHIMLFMIQFFLWYLFKFDLDYLYDLGLENNPHRSNFYGLYRATGLFSEPSIYSTYILAIVTIKYWLDDKINNVMWIGLLSMLLSFSTMALFQVASFLFFVYARINLRSIITLVLSILVLVSLFMDTVISRLNLFISGDDSSNSAKTYIFEHWISNENLFHYGYSYIDKFKAGKEFIALGDLTFWLNNFMFFGLYMGFFLLFIYLFRFFKGNEFRCKILISIVLFKLSTFTFPLTALLVAIYFSLGNKQHRGL